MDSADQVSERGRAAYDRRVWSEAFACLAQAHRADRLGPADLDRLAVAAYLTGRDDDADEYAAQAYRAWVREHEPRAAARRAAWLALHLLLRGEEVRSHAWSARAEEVLDGVDGGPDPERGFLLVPAGLVQMADGQPAAALATYQAVAELGERFDEPDLAAIGQLGHGEALRALGRVDEAMERLDEAMVAVTAGRGQPGRRRHHLLRGDRRVRGRLRPPPGPPVDLRPGPLVRDPAGAGAVPRHPAGCTVPTSSSSAASGPTRPTRPTRPARCSADDRPLARRTTGSRSCIGCAGGTTTPSAASGRPVDGSGIHNRPGAAAPGPGTDRRCGRGHRGRARPDPGPSRTGAAAARLRRGDAHRRGSDRRRGGRRRAGPDRARAGRPAARGRCAVRRGHLRDRGRRRPDRAGEAARVVDAMARTRCAVRVGAGASSDGRGPLAARRSRLGGARTGGGRVGLRPPRCRTGPGAGTPALHPERAGRPADRTGGRGAPVWSRPARPTGPWPPGCSSARRPWLDTSATSSPSSACPRGPPPRPTPTSTGCSRTPRRRGLTPSAGELPRVGLDRAPASAGPARLRRTASSRLPRRQ